MPAQLVALIAIRITSEDDGDTDEDRSCIPTFPW